MLTFGSKQQSKNAFMSLYHGDFEQIGHELASLTDGFKDFTLLMNIPYGHQSAQAQRHSSRDTQNLYRRLGRFLQTYEKGPVQTSPKTNAEDGQLVIS